MKFAIVAVGKIRDKGLARLAEDYAGRLKKFVPFRQHEVKDGRGGDPTTTMRIEGERLLTKLPAGCRVVLLDERGTNLSSVEMSLAVDRWTRTGVRDVRFVVGGPDGFSPAVRDRADEAWRLSSLTLPHEVARVILLEQLYRSWTILRGIPYHKDG